jgi:hypothetical protein
LQTTRGEDDEVHAGQVVGHAALFATAGLCLQPVDQVDDVEEATTCAVANERPRDGDAEVGLAGSGAADQDDIALVCHETAGGQIAHQALVDRRAGEVERVDVFGQRQLGDGHLVANGARLLLGDLGLQEVAHNARWLMLALDARTHDRIIGTAHPVELEAAHQVEDLGSFHVWLSS